MDHKIKDMLDQIEVPNGLQEDLLKIKNQNSDTGDHRKWTMISKIGKVAAVVLGIAAIGSGSVYAASKILGIRDFEQTLPEEAEPYINTEVTVSDVVQNIPANEEEVTSDLVTFRVKETVADTSNCLVVIEATLQDPKHYLMLWGADEYPYLEESENFPASNLYEDAMQGESLADYAFRMNKEILGVYVDTARDAKLEPMGDYAADSLDYRQEDASHAAFYLNCSTFQMNADRIVSEDPTLYITNVVRTYTIDGNSYTSKECMNETITVNLENVAVSEETAVYAFMDEADMRVEDSSILVKDVRITNTELETKYTMDVVNEDLEVGNMIDWSLIYDDGSFCQPGTTGMGSAGVPDDQGAFRIEGSVQKMELPDHVNVWFSDPYTGEQYIIWNIPLTEEE